MKKILFKGRCLRFSLIIMFLLTPNLFTRNLITEGKEFWFGLPHKGGSTNETIRWGTSPVELWISSRTPTLVHINDASGASGQITYDLNDNQIKVVPLSMVLQNTESEIICQKGIHITADDPISVTVAYTYIFSGETFKLIPVEYLGKKYFTLNLYQDKFNQLSSGTVYKTPGQILIVGTKDNTTVNFKPSCETAGGIKKGVNKQIILNEGETYLIEAKIFEALNQDWSTDLSGTYIQANKPIAVISGHTKGTFPRYPASYYGYRTECSRNMLIEMMLPVELLGTEYITIPVKYNYKAFTDFYPDERGDMLRFIATENNTFIYQMRLDGSGMKQLSTEMKAGDWFDVCNGTLETPSYFKANKPVLAGQYAKGSFPFGFRLNLSENTGSQHLSQYNSFLSSGMLSDLNNTELLMLYNQTLNLGLGMLMVVIPVDRWTDYAMFNVPPNVSSHVNISFRLDKTDDLKFDGEKFSSALSSKIKIIPGTPFAYVTLDVSAGSHSIEGFNDATFAGYVYGDVTQIEEAFAYGYQVGMNFGKVCSDSLYIIDNSICGDVDGTAYDIDLDPDSSCAGIKNINTIPGETINYITELSAGFEIGDESCNFHLTTVDITKYAKTVLKVQSVTGNSIEKIYEYFPEDVEAKNPDINFGILKINSDSCLSIILKNPLSYPVTVWELILKNGSEEFSIDTAVFPLTLQPDMEFEVTICAKAGPVASQIISDSIVAEFYCFPKTIASLTFETAEPSLWISDARWTDVPFGSSSKKTVTIENRSTVNAEILGMDWDDKIHFGNIEGIILPLTLTPYEYIEFSVQYTPTENNAADSTRVFLTSDCAKEKLYSDWVGNSILLSYSDGRIKENSGRALINKCSPNPTNEITTIEYLAAGNEKIKISLNDCLGKMVAVLFEGESAAGENMININFKQLGLTQGIYYIRLETGIFVDVEPLIYIED